MKHFKTVLNHIKLKLFPLSLPPHPPPPAHHCTKCAAGAPVAAARLYQGRGIAAAWHLSTVSTRDYSALTSKEVCLTWVWRCAGSASPWSSLAVLISPPQTFLCFSAAGNTDTSRVGPAHLDVHVGKHLSAFSGTKTRARAHARAPSQKHTLLRQPFLSLFIYFLFLILAGFVLLSEFLSLLCICGEPRQVQWIFEMG